MCLLTISIVIVLEHEGSVKKYFFHFQPVLIGRPGAGFAEIFAEFLLNYFSLAGIAQLVEQLIRNQQVVGSSPIPGSTLLPRVSST
jgi:hypothetical protein